MFNPLWRDHRCGAGGAFHSKHDAAFPVNAIKFCLDFANITANDIENVVFYEKPFLKFERLLETYLSFAPKGFSSFSKAIPYGQPKNFFKKKHILNELSKISAKDIDWKSKLLFAEHHQSHAASAFYPSPYNEAAILTFDGVGEWATTSVGLGEDRSIKLQKEIRFPHSLGLLYSAFTYFTGFKVNSGEYKVMGLAPYGQPVYASKIREELIDIAEDGSFQLNMRYFDFAAGLKMTNDRFDKLFDGPPRRPESALTQREMDLAASVQEVVEDVILLAAKNIAVETKNKNLCLAGGVALNCVANGLLSKKKIFENIWIQPAAGDAGGAVGAAFIGWHDFHRAPRRLIGATDLMKGAYLGPEFADKAVAESLEQNGAKFHVLSEEDVIMETVSAIKQERRSDGCRAEWSLGHELSVQGVYLLTHGQ